jgi:GT2 family glycosyltransferase
MIPCSPETSLSPIAHLSGPSLLASVIVPLYNADQFVVPAVRSILQEQSIPLEVIVVDDGSTDLSLQELRQISDSRLKVIENPEKGIASALNAGFMAAQGAIIARCDADDLYTPGRLVWKINWLQEHPEFGAICGGYSAIDPKGNTVIQFDCGKQPEEITQELRRGITRTHFCTFAVRTEVMRAIGGCRPYFRTGEDIDLQFRLGEACRVWYAPEMSYQYRLHGSSITHTIGSTEREFFDAIARQFQQQRQKNGLDDLQRGCPPAAPQASPKPPLTAADHIQDLLMGRAWGEFQRGDRLHALAIGLRSVMTDPRNVSAWKSLLVLAVKSHRKWGMGNSLNSNYQLPMSDAKKH